MKAICASVNLYLFMVLPRPTARIAHAAKLEFSSKDRSENREAGHGRCASVAGGAGRRSAAGHAANAGMNTSGAGGLYPIEAWGLIVLRRLLAIAAVLDGASREEAAKISGMDRQTLRDWVIRFNEQGADGLINIPSPGIPPKLNAIHKAFLARIVEDGPIAAIHGVVRWRACDLIMRLYEEFGLSVSDDTIYRALKKLGFSHMSARPKAYKQNAEAMEAFKKTSPSVWRKSTRSSHPAHR